MVDTFATAGMDPEPLLSPGLDPAQRSAIVDLRLDLIQRTGEPMSELPPPHIRIEGVRFVVDEVAVLELVCETHGSSVSRPVPLLMIARKEAGAWRIFSVHRLTAPLPEFRTP
jgi:hypothetical protein